MKLTLVRHGETPGNVLGSLDTAVPGPGLTQRGTTQAAALVERFAGEEFDAIYASTHVRTQITAAPIAADRALPVRVLAELGEFNAGDLEGRSDRDAIGLFSATLRAWIVGDHDARFPGGESGRQVLDRMDAGIAVVAGAGHESALVVSHGGALRLWAGVRARNIDTEFALGNYLVNTGVIVFTGSIDDGWHCESWDLPPATRPY